MYIENDILRSIDYLHEDSKKYKAFDFSLSDDFIDFYEYEHDIDVLDNLRCRYFNLLIDMNELVHYGGEIKNIRFYIKLYEYFNVSNDFSDEQKDEWIARFMEKNIERFLL